MSEVQKKKPITSYIPWRFLGALALVFFTYNPSGYSMFDVTKVVLGNMDLFETWMIFVVAIVGVGWFLYIKATLQSLGIAGTLLVIVLAGIALVSIADLGIIPIDDPVILAYSIEVLTAIILTLGMTWSSIWRRITGQVDVNDVNA